MSLNFTAKKLEYLNAKQKMIETTFKSKSKIISTDKTWDTLKRNIGLYGFDVHKSCIIVK